MSQRADHLRFVLGLKLKCMRAEQGRSLQEVARCAGLSVSYLSEIEKGKKYPKPEKLLDLAEALGVPFDGLVSLKVDRVLDPVKEALGSSFMQAFPFALFGLSPNDLFSLLRDTPERVGALVQTIMEVGRRHDVRVEHFLSAALRAYQQMHVNYFDELEKAASAFRAREGWMTDAPVGESRLRALLERRHGYCIDENTLADHPDLHTCRSVYLNGRPPTLFVNGRLLAGQKAFVYARELGFLHLGLDKRPQTSPSTEATSFDEVLNQFKASYFAGALLIDHDRLLEDVEAFFSRDRWHGETLLNVLALYRATPEMFCHRLAQLIPQRFGLDALYMLRCHYEVETDDVRLMHVLNLSPVSAPYEMDRNEHYCRRWSLVKLLRQLGRREHAEPDRPLIAAQRSHFMDADAEFFEVSFARPLALRRGVHAGVSLGFLIDDTFRRTVRFWDDPAVPRLEVNLTCERCPLTPAVCRERAAPPSLHVLRRQKEQLERALEALMRDGEPASG